MDSETKELIDFYVATKVMMKIHNDLYLDSSVVNPKLFIYGSGSDFSDNFGSGFFPNPNPITYPTYILMEEANAKFMEK